MLPGLLSTLAVGGAAMARLAVGWLMPVLFAMSVALLAYAHYRAWAGHGGRRAAKIVLIVNTGLVIWLWSYRVKLWLGF